VKLIDVNTSEGKLFASFSSHPFVLSVNERKREFVIMDYTPDKFILATIDYEGNQISKRQIDRFNDVYYLDTICALSPDRRYLVYLDRYNYLYLLDLKTGGKTNLICEQLVSSESNLRGLRWVSDSEILIIKKMGPLLSKYSPVEHSALIRFDVETKSTVRKIELTCPEKFKVSPSGKYLVVLDGFSIHQDFKLFDLRTLNLLEFRKNSGFEYIDDVCWSPSEEYLAYVKNDSIMIRSRASAQEREVKVLPKRAICYFLAFLDENTLIYRYGLHPDSPERYILRSIDLKTGKESILIKNEILSGNIYVVDNGKKLIAEVGD
jgi:WD40 repeat protein